MRQIGRRVRPLDWESITSGRFTYGTDLVLDGMLTGRVLRSPHAHAQISALDVSQARTMPGVHAVITAADFPPGIRYLHEGAADRPPIAGDVVRFVGQEVAAVAAETREQADAALRVIRVGYKPLEAPFTIDEALARGAPRLHERSTGVANLARRLMRRWGDPEAARARGPVTVEGTYWYPHQTHVCMEPNVTVASWDEAKQKLHLWTGTQAPALVIEEVAHVLGLEIEQVLCHETGVGGAFGSKSRVSEHEAIAAALSRATNRPVRVALSRFEEFATTKTRHAFRTALRLHADTDGRMHAIDARIVADNGAFVHSGYSVLSAGPKAFGTLYEFEGLEVEALLVDTAKQPGGQFRGYGTTQSVYALESLMDDLAERLKIDPIEIRKRNANRPATRTLQGARVQTARLSECLDAVREAIGWSEKKAHRRRDRGVGVAVGIHASGVYAQPGANRNDSAIDIFADGRVLVRFGGVDTGTGQRTILAQIAANEIGIDFEKVSVLSTETTKTPYDLGAWGTRGTFYSGNAARKAAIEAADRLRALAAPQLGNEPIVLDHGMARSGGRAVPIGELVRSSPDTIDGCLTVESSFVETDVEMPDSEGVGNVSATYSFAAHAAEVEVDRRTGRIRVLDVVAAHDVGTAINPTMVEGQIAGGVAMSLGVALGEELIHEQGRPVNPSYLNYAMPRAGDLPRIRTILVEGGDPKGPYGAKGVGELCITPGAPAVANAVYDAIGVRVPDLPITPDKILTALAAKEGRRRRHAIWRRPDRWWVAFVRWAYPRGLFLLLSRWGVRTITRPEPHTIDAIEMPATLEGALNALRADATPIGGGTDLLPARLQGLVAPARVVSLVDVPELQKVEWSADGSVVIGAAVTLARLAKEVGERAPIVAEAVEHIATQQIRAMATIGGNLLQEKRCWFYRNGFDCYKRGGFGRPCYAVMGDHRFYHAAMGAHRCQAVTPSDLATVLVALDGEAIIDGPGAKRTIPVAALYRGPGESVLRRNELLTSVRIDAKAFSRRGRYEKLGLWEGDFAIASVAMTFVPRDDGGWGDPRVALGGIAPRPWRARKVERQLDGAFPSATSVRAALDAELDAHAHPLPHNFWKLDAVAGLAEHATERLLQGGAAGNAARA